MEKAIQDYLDGNQIEIGDDLSKCLSSNGLNILNLVELLKDGFSSLIGVVRGKSCRVMKMFIENHLQSLHPREYQFCFEFFLSKLEDDSCIVQAVAIIDIMLQRVEFMDEQLVDSLLHQIADLQVQTLAQSTRYTVYRIMQSCSNCKAISGNIVLQYRLASEFINAFEGERDPRNIQLGLTVILNALDSLPTDATDKQKDILGDVFDVCSMYFPITYKTPDNVRDAVSANALKQLLYNCLIAREENGDRCIDLIIENLGEQEELLNVKEALRLLSVTAQSSCNVQESLLKRVDDLAPYIIQLYEVNDLVNDLCEALQTLGTQLTDSQFGILFNPLKEKMDFLKYSSINLSRYINILVKGFACVSHQRFSSILQDCLMPLLTGKQSVSFGNKALVSLFTLEILAVLKNQYAVESSDSSTEQSFAKLVIIGLVPFILGFLDSDRPVDVKINGMKCIQILINDYKWVQYLDLNACCESMLNAMVSDHQDLSDVACKSLGSLQDKQLLGNLWSQIKDDIPKYGKAVQQLMEFRVWNFIVAQDPQLLDLKESDQFISTCVCLAYKHQFQESMTILESRLDAALQQDLVQHPQIFGVLLAQMNCEKQQTLLRTYCDKETSNHDIEVFAIGLRPEVDISCIKDEVMMSQSLEVIHLFANKFAPQITSLLPKVVESLGPGSKMVIAKALIMRSDSFGYKLLDEMLQMMVDLNVLEKVFQSSTLSRDAYWHCVSKPLHTQRLYLHIKKYLTTEQKSGDASFAMKVFCLMITHLQQTIISQDGDFIAEQLKLALESCFNDEYTVRALFHVINVAHQFILKDLNDFMRLLINGLQNVDAKLNLVVLARTLQCLSLISKLPADKVLRFYNQVIKISALYLGHKKRVVRSAAVQCRNSWYLVNSE
ncbi:hypothetical protein MP228_009352 [Amoeboaphelidium protococcarum]|nr:hypothetical protein MP228_009352 [Amoeboaphelidium protococcarum]